MDENLSLPDLVLSWGSSLIEPSSSQEVFTQAFDAHQGNSKGRARLEDHLNESFAQKLRLAERAKDEGRIDPEISTAAVALMLQAVEVGVHTIRSGGLDEENFPAIDEWVACMEKYLGGIRPTPTD